MGREWQIGDPVDYTTDGWMDAQNWGHGVDDDERSETGRNSSDPRVEEYADKAWKLYMDYNETEALRYIDMSLDLDGSNSKNWNIKTIILEAMKRFDESEKCYNKSLELGPQNIVYDNKARMLYDWVVQLLEESKKLSNGLEMLGRASDILKRAIRALPGENSEEDLEKYLRLWDSINFYIGYENKFQRNLEFLKGYDRSVLFTITGTHLFKNGAKLTPGKPLRLVMEPENEFDGDAIAVYAGDEKVGYVANSPATKYAMTSSASELKGRLHDAACGEYLLYLSRYADIDFHIGKIR